MNPVNTVLQQTNNRQRVRSINSLGLLRLRLTTIRILHRRHHTRNHKITNNRVLTNNMGKHHSRTKRLRLQPSIRRIKLTMNFYVPTISQLLLSLLTHHIRSVRITPGTVSPTTIPQPNSRNSLTQRLSNKFRLTHINIVRNRPHQLSLRLIRRRLSQTLVSNRHLTIKQRIRTRRTLRPLLNNTRLSTPSHLTKIRVSRNSKFNPIRRRPNTNTLLISSQGTQRQAHIFGLSRLISLRSLNVRRRRLIKTNKSRRVITNRNKTNRRRHNGNHHNRVLRRHRAFILKGAS